MQWLSLFIIGFLCPQVIYGIAYSIYNFNGHSYYIFNIITYLYNYEDNCSEDNNYPVYIQNEQEDKVIASVLRHDSAIGLYNIWGSFTVYYSYHTSKKITYSNWISGNTNSYGSDVKINYKNGKWDKTSKFGYMYIICENDQISSDGINVTSDKLINIKTDYLLTYRGHSYYVYHVGRDFETVRRICKNDHDGYVFIPNDGSENCALHETIANDVYLGITSQKSTFATDKGYNASYLPWIPGNPKTQECVVRGITGGFYSSSCSSTKHIICETDSVVAGANSTNCSSKNKKHYFSQTFYYNDYAFYAFDIKTNQNEAVNLCEERGETLFTAQNEQENCAFMENIFSSVELNYGQHYVKNVNVRGDGITSNYTNWDTGYPLDVSSNPCVFAQFNSGKWINGPCKDSTFACRRKATGVASNIDCTHSYIEDLSVSYSFTYDSSTYSMFGYKQSYHNSVRLCAYYGQKLVQTTRSDLINKIKDFLIKTNFHMDYRIQWTEDGKLSWLGDSPKDTPNWGPGEPKLVDFQISCVSVMPNGTWKTNLCSDKNIAVCEGNLAPTGSTTSTASTTTTTTTTTASETTTASTTQSTTASNTAASKHSNSVGLGVGLFFGILAVLGLVLGFFIYGKKQGMSFNILSSIVSFKKKTTFSEEMTI